MTDPDAQSRYFTTPQDAVTKITELLCAEDWRELAEYYAVDAQDELRPSMLDGSFFVNREKPEVCHPAGFWRTKQPFSPGFEYFSHASVEDNLLQVTVRIEVQQGADSPTQVGLGSFYLTQSPEGLQVVANRDEPETPSSHCVPPKLEALELDPMPSLQLTPTLPDKVDDSWGFWLIHQGWGARILIAAALLGVAALLYSQMG